VLLRIVLHVRVVLPAEFARLAATTGVILLTVLLAALGAFFTAFGAFFAAALAFMLARHTFSAALRAFGATRFGFLLLIGLRRSLAHRNCKSSQHEHEQHYEYSALLGFHVCSPMEMITVRDTSAHTGTSVVSTLMS
jgi:hypothetical protein